MTAPAAQRNNLSGRKLLVLGASSGVGRAVAETLAQSGAEVVLAARRRARLESAVAKLAHAGHRAHAIVCDVTDEARCRRAVAAAIHKLGGLDGFVYAPGLATLTPLAEASQKEWRRTLDTNLVGAALVTAAALDALRESRGRAVFVGSYVVRQALPGVGLYSTSKAALAALIKAWRLEAPEVDFTHAVLGNTRDTEFAAHWGAERVAAVTKQWVAAGALPTAQMMALEDAAEGIACVFGVRGYVDEISIMPRGGVSGRGWCRRGSEE